MLVADEQLAGGVPLQGALELVGDVAQVTYGYGTTADLDVAYRALSCSDAADDSVR